MPLRSKGLKTSQIKCMLDVCCYPVCCPSAGILCSLCALFTLCKVDCFKDIAFATCLPCIGDTPLERKASSISSKALSLSFVALLENKDDVAVTKLASYKTLKWDPAKHFDLGALFDNTSRTFERHVKNAIYSVLDEYNLGTVANESLTEEETRFIGTELRTAIFSRLPASDDFFRQAEESKIDTNDPIALKGFLYGKLYGIVNGSFVHDQLNVISDRVEANRAARNLTNSQQQATLFKAMQNGMISQPAEQKMESVLPIEQNTPALPEVHLQQITFHNV